MEKIQALRADKKLLEESVEVLIKKFNDKHPDFSVDEIRVYPRYMNDLRADKKVLDALTVEAQIKVL